MNDPYRLIDDLYAKQFDKVGMVKLVPPKHNRNAWATLKSKLGSKRLVTRRQEVRNLTDGKVRCVILKLSPSSKISRATLWMNIVRWHKSSSRATQVKFRR